MQAMYFTKEAVQVSDSICFVYSSFAPRRRNDTLDQALSFTLSEHPQTIWSVIEFSFLLKMSFHLFWIEKVAKTQGIRPNLKHSSLPKFVDSFIARAIIILNYAIRVMQFQLNHLHTPTACSIILWPRLADSMKSFKCL